MTSTRFPELEKICQHLRAVRARAFRMKLGGDEIAALDHGGEIPAVLATPRGAVRDRQRVTVNEVELRAVRNTGQQS